MPVLLRILNFLPESKNFPVTILDEQEREVGKGDLLVTKENMELTQQGKKTLTWELRYLRRFGYDKQYFSFEAGRRCTDGPGIWAVKTPKARLLFRMVDHHINKTEQPPSQEKHEQGGEIKRAKYAGVRIIGDNQNSTDGDNVPTKLSYAQLALSSKTSVNITPTFVYLLLRLSDSDLDFEQMEAQAQLMDHDFIDVNSGMDVLDEVWGNFTIAVPGSLDPNAVAFWQSFFAQVVWLAEASSLLGQVQKQRVKVQKRAVASTNTKENRIVSNKQDDTRDQKGSSNEKKKKE
eukprot:gene9197-1484_t